jgi:hypothetical protein
MTGALKCELRLAAPVKKVLESEQIDEIMSFQYNQTKADICYGIRSPEINIVYKTVS